MHTVKLHVETHPAIYVEILPLELDRAIYDAAYSYL